MAITLSSEDHTRYHGANGTNKKILMLYAGGIMDHSELGNDASPLKPMNFNEVLNQLSNDFESHRNRGIEVVPECYESMVSTNYSLKDWKEIASRVYSHRDIDGAVVLHGVDTMDYTASALSFMLENLRIPVVLTGGLTPLSKVRSNARENTAAAFSIAAGLDVSAEKDVPIIPEVCVYTTRFDRPKDLDRGKSAKLLRGNRTIQFDTNGGFESPNYPPLCEDDFFFYPKNILPMPGESEASNLYTEFDDRIMLLSWENNVLDGKLIRQTIENQLSYNPKAVVVSSVLSSDSRNVPKLLKTLYEVKNRDVPVILASNQKSGVVLSEELKRELDKMGMTSAGDMTVPAAFTKTSYLLGKGRMDLITRNLRGEISGPLVRSFD
jgi:L-asparaginase